MSVPILLSMPERRSFALLCPAAGPCARNGRPLPLPRSRNPCRTESLVPENHLLRKTDGAVGLDRLHDMAEPLYCEDNGRPSIDPVALMKLALIQHLYGLPSLRRTAEEVSVNGSSINSIKSVRKRSSASLPMQNKKHAMRLHGVSSSVCYILFVDKSVPSYGGILCWR